MQRDKKASSLTWAHIGDLHITDRSEGNYRDFLATIESMNTNLAGRVNFCVLPGDNADDGLASQYALIRTGLDRMSMPVHVIPGDHDFKTGDLRAFYHGLRVAQLPYAILADGHRCLFLDAVSNGAGGPHFALGRDQLDWLALELRSAAAGGQTSVIFMHAYPSDLDQERHVLTDLLHRNKVSVVDMGHTHYNEISNDGTTIFATTRSTGQIEEGPVGFSLASISNDVVSWRFKPLQSPWPFVMITSPADHRLATKLEHPAHLVSGSFMVQARVFGATPTLACRCRINQGSWISMPRTPETWETMCEAPRQPFTLCVEAKDHLGDTDTDTIVVAAPGYRPPDRSADGSDADAIGPWIERHLLGTRLGPNRNGRQ